MFQRSRLAVLALFFAGLVTGVAVIVFLGGRMPTTPEAKAADDKPATPTIRYHLFEEGPSNKIKVGWSGSVQEFVIYVVREVHPSGKSVYFINCWSNIYGYLKCAPEDIDALVKLDQKLKGKKKTEAKEVGAAVVQCWLHNYENGKERLFSCTLGKGWISAGSNSEVSLGEDFIPTLEKALKDVEALKKVDPSVKW